MIHSYPSIFALGHKAVADIFAEPVLVEEKIDGSQFSFGVYTIPVEGTLSLELRCRSKGAQLQILAPEKMFIRAIETVQRLAPLLQVNWTYRAEYLAKPKHNTIAYSRIPASHIMIFDINTGQEEYLSWDAKQEEAARLGLEVVPVLYRGMVTSVDMFRELLSTVSILGGSEIEGTVVKNYARFTNEKKAMMAKFVSERFKEVHAAEWKQSNPKSGDILERLAAMYKNPARWDKAVQHLREAGKLEDSPKDIGLLFKEVPADILKECEEEIKDLLFQWAWPRIQRATTAGMAEWYKEQLLSRQFNQDTADSQPQKDEKNAQET